MGTIGLERRTRRILQSLRAKPTPASPMWLSRTLLPAKSMVKISLKLAGGCSQWSMAEWAAEIVSPSKWGPDDMGLAMYLVGYEDKTVLAVATATAEGLRRVGDATTQKGGTEAMQLRIAEQYLALMGVSLPRPPAVVAPPSPPHPAPTYNVSRPDDVPEAPQR